MNIVEEDKIRNIDPLSPGIQTTFELSNLETRKLGHLDISDHSLDPRVGTAITIRSVQWNIPFLFPSATELIEFISYCLTVGEITDTSSPEQDWPGLRRKFFEYKRGYASEIMRRLDKWESMNQLCGYSPSFHLRMPV